MTGLIAPLATTPKVVLDANANVYPKIELGINSGSFLLWDGPKGQSLFSIAGDNAVVLIIEDGVVKLSTTVRDKTGTVIAQMIKNEWKINPGASWDRNYSTDAIEVMDPTGDVVLQAISLSDRVQFSAKMYGKNGEYLGLGSANPGTTGAGGVLAVFPAHGPFIPPIFKYPSNTHLGETSQVEPRGF